jgi:hypothetical protein
MDFTFGGVCHIELLGRYERSKTKVRGEVESDESE